MPLVLVGALLAAYAWKTSADTAQTNQRNAAEVNELRGRGATLEMMQNPMWEQQQHQRGPINTAGSATTNVGTAAAAASDVYYSEVADVPQRDSDGYMVDDDSIVTHPEPVVYATYATGSPGASDTHHPYAACEALTDGQMYAASIDAGGVEEQPRPYSTLSVATSGAAVYAVPVEAGGIAYASSAAATTRSTPYENSRVLVCQKAHRVDLANGAGQRGRSQGSGAASKSSRA